MVLKLGFKLGCPALRVQKNWDSKHPLVDLIIGLNIKPKLEDWFLNLGGAPNFLNIGTAQIWQNYDATLAPLHFPYLRIKTLV